MTTQTTLVQDNERLQTQYRQERINSTFMEVIYGATQDSELGMRERIDDHNDRMLRALNNDSNLDRLQVITNSLGEINSVLQRNSMLGTRYARPLYRVVMSDGRMQVVHRIYNGREGWMAREDVIMHRLRHNRNVNQLASLRSDLGYNTDIKMVGYRSQLNSMHLNSRSGECVERKISRDDADIQVEIVREKSSKLVDKEKLALYTNSDLPLKKNDLISRILNENEIFKLRFNGRLNRISDSIQNARHIIQGGKLRLLDGTYLDPNAIQSALRQTDPLSVQIEHGLHLRYEMSYKCTLKIPLILEELQGRPQIDIICVGNINESNMAKIIEGTKDTIQFNITFWVTVIRKTSNIATLVSNRKNWIPYKTNDTFAIIDSNGEKVEEEISKQYAQIDPFTTLPLPADLKDRDTNAYGMHGYQAVTRGGVEFEDVIALRDTNVYDNCLKLFDGVISELLSFDDPGLFPEAESQNRDRMRMIAREINKYVAIESSPTITHSDQVWSIQREFNKFRVENTFTLNDLKVRFMLSKLFLASVSDSELFPLHLRNRNDIELQKIPLCITQKDILIYTLDSSLVELLVTFKNDPTVHAMKMKSQYFSRDEGKRYISPVAPEVVGRSQCLPVHLSDVEDVDCTHHILTSDNKLLNFDEVILEMSIISLGYLKSKRLSEGSFVIWHPDYCIILSTKGNLDYKDKVSLKRFNCYIIDSPRRTRIVKASHNTSELIFNMKNNRRVHGELSTQSEGYLGALLREFN